MVFKGKMSPRVYFTAPNIHNDGNLKITIIHDVLSHWGGNLHEILYLQDRQHLSLKQKTNCFWISNHAC